MIFPSGVLDSILITVYGGRISSFSSGIQDDPNLLIFPAFQQSSGIVNTMMDWSPTALQPPRIFVARDFFSDHDMYVATLAISPSLRF